MLKYVGAIYIYIFLDGWYNASLPKEWITALGTIKLHHSGQPLLLTSLLIQKMNWYKYRWPCVPMLSVDFPTPTMCKHSTTTVNTILAYTSSAKRDLLGFFVCGAFVISVNVLDILRCANTCIAITKSLLQQKSRNYRTLNQNTLNLKLINRMPLQELLQGQIYTCCVS